jgi:hypothetical protein
MRLGFLTGSKTIPPSMLSGAVGATPSTCLKVRG